MHNQNSLLKGILKRLSVYLLVVFMVLPVFFVVSFEDGNITIKEVDNPLVAKADAGTVNLTGTNASGTWISGKLTYAATCTTTSNNTNEASGSVSVSNNTITVKAKSATSYKSGSGCNATTVEAAGTTTEVTVTNSASFPLEFTSISSTGSAVVSGVKQGDTIKKGATFTIKVTSNAGESEKTGTVTVAVEAQTNLTLTLLPSPYTSYIVEGTTVQQNGSQQTISAKVNDKITLPSITAPAGRVFKGWLVDTDMVQPGEITVLGGHKIFPVIVSENIDVQANNFKVGTDYYTFWEDAVTAAVKGSSKTVIVNIDMTLPSDLYDNLLSVNGSYVKAVDGGGVEYTVPSGVTLLVPYNSSGTVSTTEPGVDNGTISAQKLFRKMTVPQNAKITVASGGALCVNSRVFSANGGTNGSGSPHGNYGQIVMEKGSNIDVSGNLYAWGFITAKDAVSSKACGTVTVQSSGKVWECFQVADQPGGSAANALKSNSYGTFLLNQYSIQNVEVPMTLHSGSVETVYTNIYIQGQNAASTVLIGQTSGLFRLTSGTITKTYDPLTDQLRYDIDGNASIENISLSVYVTVDTKNFVLPINCNMDIFVHSGTTTLKNKIELHPGVKIKIDQGAKAVVAGTLYVFDAQDWKVGYFGPVVKECRTVPYSPTKSASHTATTDVMLDVNGELEVSGKMYTTQNGADIKSSEGTGQIKFSSDPGSSTATLTKAMSITGNSLSSSIGSTENITMYPPKLHNGPIYTGDDEYTSVSGTGASTWKYDKDGDHWYRYLVDFEYNGASVGHGFYCENNDTVTYDASWLTGLTATASSGTATIATGNIVEVTGVSANSTVTLTGTPATYIPTFVLSENEYKNYKNFTGNTITNTTTIGGKTYYIVAQATSDFSVGDSYAAPTDAAMGVTAANHNGIKWNMTGIEDSGAAYAGKVPVGETAGGAVYIYGYYSGVVAYNSGTEQYYSTLLGAVDALSETTGDVTITLVADCGSFEEESGTTLYAVTPGNYTLDLAGYKALGRILNGGNFTLELNGGSLDYVTGAAARDAAYKGMATIINNSQLTIIDTAGGGSITGDAVSTNSGSDGTAIIRNNTGATMSITGKDADHLITVKQASEFEETYNSSYGYYAYNYGIYNLGTITTLTDVNLISTQSRTCGVGIYNYNTGVINKISGGHMFCAGSASIFNYGGNITDIDGVTIDGKNGITNRNLRTGAIASGYTVAEADKGIIDTIQNCHIEVGQYAINNNAIINTVKSCTLIAHPDSAQVDTRGNGSTASEGNVQCYTVYNTGNWWYDTNVWKQVDSSSGGYTRVNYYKEEEQYRPTIGTIKDCNIYAELTSTSASHGYALYNTGGIINTIDGETSIKAYKHPDNAKISVGYYAMHNLAGGIIKSIKGTVNISSTLGTVYNDGQFTAQINYTYANKVGGNITYQKNTYGEPSTINSITCSGTWSCAGSNSYYYALMNSGYIGTINSTGLTLTGGYNVLYNATGSANKTYEINRYYTNGATASTEYKRVQTYVKNLEKGSTIGTINGITVTGKGSKSYYPFNNQGHIGTLSNTTVNFAEGATANSSYYVAMLNGDSRYAEYTETIQTNRTAETDPHLTVSAGIVTKYDRSYEYDTPTIDEIDNLTVTSMTAYAMRNAGHIGTLKNSTITGTQYALHNSDSGPYTERQSEQYYSGTSIFATTKGSSDLSNHYKKNASTIGLIDNCTITTPANTYAMLNGGHVGTIKNSTLQSGTTTAKAYALANTSSTIREYTRDLSDIVYITANAGTSCTTYYGCNGETNVVVYDYDAPVVDLIGEGNTFKATAPVITNTGIITEINSGTGTKTTVTESAAKYYAIYNYSANLDTRTTTTPYTAATAANTSGTAGTAVNSDTLQPGAQIGTIKNVYIDSNGYGILNGDASAGKLPTIGEIGEGTEIYAHCTTAGYHAIYNQANAKITSITGGVYTTTKATTNAYKNNNTDPDLATEISGGDFKGMSATRANAIYEPDNTNRQTYSTGKVLSSASRSVNFNNGTTVASGTGYYYINNAYTVTWKSQDGSATLETDTGIEAGTNTKPSYNGTEPTKAPDDTYKYTFAGWATEPDQETGTAAANLPAVTENVTYYAAFSKTFNNCKVIWKSQDGTQTLETDNEVTYDTKPEFNGTEPKKTASAEYTYTFAGWATSADQESGTLAANLPNVTGDTTYYAAFSKTVNQYTITFVDGDGNVKQTGKWNYGATPSYNQSANGTPTKTQDAQYTYAFNNTWSPAITSVTGDATYTAQFDGTTRSYNITFVNDGETVQTDKDVEYGQTAAVPEDQTKTTDSQYTYEFAGWQDQNGTVYASAEDIPPVEGEATYTAYYEEVVNEYEVQWVDDTGTPLQTDTAVPYGTKPEYKQETVPTKPATPEHYYEFSGWEYSYTLPEGVIDLNDPSKSGIPKSTSRKGMTKGEEEAINNGVVPVIGISTFTAKFTEYDQKYTVKWQNDGVDLVAPIPDLDYQAKVSYSGSTPTKDKTAQYTYTFNGWNYEYTEFGTGAKKTGHIASGAEFTVLADTVFTADFSKATNYYNVTWKNWNGTVLSGPINTAYNEYRSYSGTPSRSPEGNIAYVFTGWDYSYTEYGSSTETTGHINPGSSIRIKADTVLTATYDETDRDYTITWKQSIDGEAATTARTTKVLYNAHPVPNASDEYVENCYFIGWYDESDNPVSEFPIPTADAVYTAKFVRYFQKHSLTLDGEIGTNFFVSLPDGTARKTVAGDQIADGYSIRYSWGNKWTDTDLDDSSYTYAVFHYGSDQYTSTDDSLVYYSDSKLYRGTVKLAPKEIHDDIYAELCYNGTPIASETYKASTYLYQVIDYSDAEIISLDLAENNTEADDLKALCKATLAYGASAQVYFMYHSGSLADSGLKDPFTHTDVASARASEITGDTENARFGKSVKAKALELDDAIWENDDFYRFTSIRNYKDIDSSFSTGYYGSSMTVETDATYTIYFYYGVGELFDVTATINGVEHEVTRQGYSGGDFVGFDIHDIASAELTDDIQVTFTSRNSSVDPCTFTVNPCVYLFNICQFETEDTNLVDLAANIFNYNQLAIKYFSNRATTP